jgi:hypothetical protein
VLVSLSPFIGLLVTSITVWLVPEADISATKSICGVLLARNIEILNIVICDAPALNNSNPNSAHHIVALAVFLMLDNCIVEGSVLCNGGLNNAALKKVVATIFELKGFCVAVVVDLLRYGVVIKESMEAKSLVSVDWEYMVVEKLETLDTKLIILNAIVAVEHVVMCVGPIEPKEQCELIDDIYIKFDVKLSLSTDFEFGIAWYKNKQSRKGLISIVPSHYFNFY